MYRFMAVVVMVVVVVVVAGCVQQQQYPRKTQADYDIEFRQKKAALKHDVSVQFSAKDAAYITRSGKNTISGQGMLRTRGGEVRTSAGNKAYLYPVTQYTSEMMDFMFKGASSGYNEYVKIDSHVIYKREISNLPSDFSKYVKEKTCDAQGNFEFSGLPDGEYFAVTSVSWTVPYYAFGISVDQIQDGELMRRIKVSGGAKERVILTQQ